jgi:hypothetical protein
MERDYGIILISLLPLLRERTLEWLAHVLILSVNQTSSANI